MTEKPNLCAVSAIHLTVRLNTNALAIPETDARPPHPPHRSARQAQA